jgi:glycosyltransferase involved in cell wall biosynthesis
MALISIIMPALRPELAVKAIQHIFVNSRRVAIEIVVVAPFDIQGDRIRHVKETEPRGVIAANIAGYAAATGDIIVAMTDDMLPQEAWLNEVEERIRMMEARFFPFAGGLNMVTAGVFGSVYGLYYPNFPVISRRSLDAVGGWFQPEFTAHYADPDLGMRVWDKGGRCELIESACIAENFAEDPATQSKHKMTTHLKDFETFAGKYHDRYGQGFKREFTDVNFNYPMGYLKNRTFTAREPARIHLLKN